MEVRSLSLDGVPTDEMRYGQIVATLIDITFCLQAVETTEIVQEESADGNAKRQFPLRWLVASFEWLDAK